MRRRVTGLLQRYSVEDATGSTEVEMEIAYYGRLVDRSILEKATSVEGQEQHAIFPPKKPGDTSSGQVRVRKTWTPNVRTKARYELTAKTPYGKNGGRTESNVEITEDFFNVFKLTAETSMKKTRYTFNPSDINDSYPKLHLVIQMDVFENTDWVKIDVEAKGVMPPDINYFREGILADVIPGIVANRTREQELKVRELYDKHFK